ncbi:hypothetical protein J18TS1_28560 [Oceanobacillus oncorhynchi subsp. incaldanensis]|uniref:Uncharacterized protein n=1 Tax=Oceanobacillus oncorhynchi TaxID=545501 RepID=A0A0A1MFL5_9BACI|nr:hypothetical protein J18TS1_28560 [Oceanobacillus oncorhynchi subsp. incaldanensis]CEI84190.1 hypothetical protein BN997_04133 [Oceanobacillus oncorhynchi]
MTLGWSDGVIFMLAAFSLLKSKKHQVNGVSKDIDKRSSGYKRRQEGLQTAPEQILGMLQRAMNAGIDPSYVLMDFWFTLPPSDQRHQRTGY